MVQLWGQGLDLDHRATEQSCLLLLGFPTPQQQGQEPWSSTDFYLIHLHDSLTSKTSRYFPLPLQPLLPPPSWLRPLTWTTTMAPYLVCQPQAFQEQWG